MTRIYTGLLVALSVMLGVSATLADTSARYTMRQTDDGFLRLDTQTGAVSTCTSQDGTWSCRAVSDDSRALTAEIEQLTRENSELRRENEQMKSELAAKADNDRTESLSGRSGIPSEKEVDKAFAFVERMLQRFKRMVEDLKDERIEGTPL
ncbi:MAG: hypothetical protein ACR2O4_03265 [Hyphomicrobiaceae bacterium]